MDYWNSLPLLSHALFGATKQKSLWNLTGNSVSLLPICLLNLRVIETPRIRKNKSHWIKGHATLNRYVLRLLSKALMKEARLTGVGRWFQRDGAAYAKPFRKASWNSGEGACLCTEGACLCTETTTGTGMQWLYHGELFKSITTLCIWFFAQQAADVGVSVLAWYDRICGTKTPGRHFSGKAVAEVYCSLPFAP